MNKIIFLFSFTAMVCAGEAAASYNVVDFGADGSDAVDDATAIQEALNAARGSTSIVEVSVPAGTYHLGRALRIYSNTHLVLAADATFLRMSGSDKVMMYGAHLASDGNPCPGDSTCGHGGYSQIKNITVAGGVWDSGMDSESITCALVLTHGDEIKIENATFRHFTEHVINCSASRNVTLDNLRFEEMLRYSGTSRDFWQQYDIGDATRYLSIEAIHLDVANEEGEPYTYPRDNTVCRDISVSKCSFRNGFAGVGNHHAINGLLETRMMVNGCSFSNLLSYAVHAHGFTNSVVAANSVDSSLGLIWAREDQLVVTNNAVNKVTGDGILLMNGSRAVVADNRISAPALHGVHVEGSEATIIGNRLANCGQCGVRAISTSPCLVKGNTIAAPGESGVSVSDCARVTITDNVIAEPTVSGVAIGGGKVELTGNRVSESRGLGCHLYDGVVVTARKNLLAGAESSGFYLKEIGTNSSLDGNVVSNTVENGIDVSGGGTLRIRNNVLGRIGLHGVVLKTNETTMANNTIVSVTGRGVTAFGGILSLAGNAIAQVGDYGVYADGTVAQIASNTLSSCGQSAVGLLNGKSCRVISNQISNPEKTGVFLTGCSATEVSANRIVSPTVSGVTVSGGSATIRANEVSDSKGLGCFFQEGAVIEAADNWILGPADSAFYLKNVGKDSSLAGNLITNVQSVGVNVVNGTGLRIVGNRLVGIARHGIMLSGASETVMTENLFSSIRGRGVTMTGGDIVMADNELAGVGEFGFYADGKAAVTLQRNRITDATGTGIRLSSPGETVLEANVITAVNSFGIHVSGAVGSVVIGNTVSSSGGVGILVASSTSCRIVGNEVAGTGAEGIYYQHSTAGEIGTNSVSGAVGVGIRVAGTADADITGNRVSESDGSLPDVRVEAAAAGNVVADNICSGNGLVFSAAARELVAYVPGDAVATLTRRPDGSALLSWAAVPLGGYGSGRYRVEYGHDASFSVCTSMEVAYDAGTSLTIDAEAAGAPLYARVRFIHRISGVEYVSSGNSVTPVSLKECRLIFKPGMGSGVMADQYLDPGLVYQLPVCTFTCVGRRFAGWISDRGRRYDDSVLVFGLTGAEGGTVVLTAQWK